MSYESGDVRFLLLRLLPRSRSVEGVFVKVDGSFRGPVLRVGSWSERGEVSTGAREGFFRGPCSKK